MRVLSTTHLSSLQPRRAWLTHVPLCTLREEKRQRKSGLGADCKKTSISGSTSLTTAAPTKLGASCWQSWTCFIPGKLGKGYMGWGAQRAGDRRVGHPAHEKSALEGGRIGDNCCLTPVVFRY